MRRASSPKSKAVAAFLLMALVVNLLGFVGRAFATTCGDYECVDQSEFSTDDPAHFGWLPSNGGNHTDNVVGWVSTMNFGLPWLGTSADGVLTVAGSSPTFHKTMYLQPGQYLIVTRAGTSFNLFGSDRLFMNVTPAGTTSFNVGSFPIPNNFQTIISNEFTVSSPGDVDIELQGDSSTTLYFDYIWIVQSSTPTPTPGAGTPTVTPVPAAATPIPTGTPYCITESATATPGPPQFELTPTATPSPNLNNWTVLDHFDFATLSSIWTVAGNGVYNSFSTGRGTSKPGAVFIPYSVAPGGWDHTSMLRTALIWRPTDVLTDTVYTDGWARADFVPTGTAVTAEVWTLDGGTLEWSQADTTQVSSGSWYNFHTELTSAGGVVAVAFLSSRSDDATSGGIYLDDIYIYGDLANSPRCDGAYISPPGGGPEPPDTTPITFPSDKPCPPNLNVPNNFWGPLLANLTLFLDGLFAFSPLHNNLNLAGTVRDLINAPIFIYLQLIAMFFDLRIPIAVVLVIIAINVADTIYNTWIKVKDAIPFV